MEILVEKLFLAENVEVKAIFTIPVCGVQLSIRGIASSRRTTSILAEWGCLVPFKGDFSLVDSEEGGLCLSCFSQQL